MKMKGRVYKRRVRAAMVYGSETCMGNEKIGENSGAVYRPIYCSDPRELR